MLTEQDCRDMYSNMILAYARDPKSTESMILALGRTDMHVLCAYLFVRALEGDLMIQRLGLNDLILDENRPLRESESPSRAFINAVEEANPGAAMAEAMSEAEIAMMEEQ